MPGFTSLSNLIANIKTSGQEDDNTFTKVGVATNFNLWHSMWLEAGNPPAGANPATTPGTAYTSPVTGAINFNNVSTAQRFGLSLGGSCPNILTMCIADRLVGVSGISVASTGVPTVSSVSLPRYTSGVGVMPFLEITTATTVAIAVGLNSYTNQAGTAGQSGPNSTAIIATMRVGDLLPLPIASGDTGVQAVSSLVVNTGGTTGVANLILIKPLMFIPLPQGNSWNERDHILQLTALPKIFDGACLMVMYFSSTTSASLLQGTARTVYG